MHMWSSKWTEMKGRNVNTRARKKRMQFLVKEVIGLDGNSRDPPNPLPEEHIPTTMNSPPSGRIRMPAK